MSALLGTTMAIGLWALLGVHRWPWRVATHLTAQPGSTASAQASRPAQRSRGRFGARSPRRDVNEISRAADLLAVALAAGVPMSQALGDVGLQRGAPDVLHAAANSLKRGNSLDAVLAELAETAAEWRSFVTVLALSSGAGRGAPEALRRFAASERLRARRDRERRARRLPVLLLLPLTTMVLPAFVLATVVPFLVLGENPLRLPPTVELPEGP